MALLTAMAIQTAAPQQAGPEASSPITAVPGQAYVPPAPAPPPIHALSAILIDAVSGQVLYERNADAQRPMASTTKIMTALIFCERVPDSAIITASPHACSVKESSMHLKPGEKLTAHDLLRAILLRSANDGCVDAAEFAAGSETAFVALMNAKATELGCAHTHFMNPHGLHDPDHYTSAHDLALIARAAMQEPRIREAVSTQRYRITRSINKRDVWMRNHSHFLGHYPGADGVKTGYTNPAGHCYVGSATHDGWQLITVLLHSPNYVQETSELMQFGFSHFQPHLIGDAGARVATCVVHGGVHPIVAARLQSKLQVVLRRGETTQVVSRPRIGPVDAPVAVGMPVGFMDAMVGEKQVYTTPLVAAEPDPMAPVPGIGRTAHRPSKLLLPASILGLCLVSLRYGTRFTALAKSARRRRRRLTKSVRGDDRAG